MCTPKPYMKLCTCDEVLDQNDNIWKLYRHDEKRPTVVGSILPPKEAPLLKQYLSKHLVDDLNSLRAFDFPHQFEDRDFIEISIGGMKIGFTYRGGNWEVVDVGIGGRGMELIESGFITENQSRW